MVNMKFLSPVLLSAIVLVSCSKPESFEYRDIRNFKIDSLGFETSTVSMDLVYFNPNNFGVNLKSIDCEVYIDHNYLGKYVLDTIMHIAKKSEFVVPSKMNVSMKNLLKNSLTSLISKDMLLEVNGKTKVGKAGIYVTVPFSYSGRHSFSIF